MTNVITIDREYGSGGSAIAEKLAAQRGLEVVQEYRDSGVSGKRARRPGLDALIADARRKQFSVVLVAAFDRVARSVKHFLQVMDEFDSLGIVFISRRENVDTSGPMGRLFLNSAAYCVWYLPGKTPIGPR